MLNLKDTNMNTKTIVNENDYSIEVHILRETLAGQIMSHLIVVDEDGFYIQRSDVAIAA
jgi:hypothetical protein